MYTRPQSIAITATHMTVELNSYSQVNEASRD